MSDLKALFHYCSTSKFQAIVESKTVRLSSMSLSNDTLEGKLVLRTFLDLAESDDVDTSKRQRLLEMLELFDDIFDGLGFCLSEERDLLSQWRGYADDGHGVSIGFSMPYLEWLADDESVPNPDRTRFRLRRIEYEPSRHREEVAPTYKEAKRLIDAGAFRLGGLRGLLEARTEEEIEADRKAQDQAHKALSLTLLGLLPKLYALKSFAFREEREWRLLSHLVHASVDTCSHHAVRDRLIPFKPVALVDLARQPIAEVLLGPKHSTPIRVIEQFLRQHGFEGVRVSRSEATYR